MVEAVGIEQPGAHPIPTILERFRGQGSMRTRPKTTNKTRYRTFLGQCHKSRMDVNRELAEVGAMFSVFDVFRGRRGR
jgi:hypothetical protein